MRWPHSPTLLLTALMTVGCSTQPDRVPDSQVRMDLSSARLAIESAGQAGARDKAAVDLFRAKAKLARAREALLTGDRVWARRLAEEADIDARVAQARAEAETLRQEPRRAGSCARSVMRKTLCCRRAPWRGFSIDWGIGYGEWSRPSHCKRFLIRTPSLPTSQNTMTPITSRAPSASASTVTRPSSGATSRAVG
jgi:hypothetical protein